MTFLWVNNNKDIHSTIIISINNYVERANIAIPMSFVNFGDRSRDLHNSGEREVPSEQKARIVHISRRKGTACVCVRAFTSVYIFNSTDLYHCLYVHKIGCLCNVGCVSVMSFLHL